MQRRLQAYLDDNALMPVRQSAYRLYHNTETAVSCPFSSFIFRSFLSCQLKLVVPRYRLDGFGRRRFSVTDPPSWNSLPDSLCDPESILSVVS